MSMVFKVAFTTNRSSEILNWMMFQYNRDILITDLQEKVAPDNFNVFQIV